MNHWIKPLKNLLNKRSSLNNTICWFWKHLRETFSTNGDLVSTWRLIEMLTLGLFSLPASEWREKKLTARKARTQKVSLLHEQTDFNQRYVSPCWFKLISQVSCRLNGKHRNKQLVNAFAEKSEELKAPRLGVICKGIRRMHSRISLEQLPEKSLGSNLKSNTENSRSCHLQWWGERKLQAIKVLQQFPSETLLSFVREFWSSFV